MWNRRDKMPQSIKMLTMLQERYTTARLSVPPQQFSQSNPPAYGRVVVVDKKKVRKMWKLKKRAQKYFKRLRKGKEEMQKLKIPAVL
jgi:hypothetical protein